ncbi:MAG: alpha/beta fold hydrolase [Acidobacteria bacterium]|nr:alpha/beta fold hydrolase [Acidobacteriota bacterium]
MTMDEPSVFPDPVLKERSLVKASFVISVRAVKNKLFLGESGAPSYLLVPQGEVPAPAHAIDPESWWALVMAAAGSGLVLLVHGYAGSSERVIQRHRKLEAGLTKFDHRGLVVSFDWPCDETSLSFFEDRHRAKHAALSLVSSSLLPLLLRLTPGGEIPIHVVAHSAGAYVVREAFDDADDHRELRRLNWLISQMIFVAADVSRDSLTEGNPTSASLCRHSVRLTNYYNAIDTALDVTRTNRVGAAPRAGRVGLPRKVHEHLVDVDCTARFGGSDISGSDITQAHSFYFSDEVWTKDLVLTLSGIIPPNLMPTRTAAGEQWALRSALKTG